MHSLHTYRQFVTQLYMEGRQCVQRVRVAMHSLHTYRQFVTQLYMEGRQCVQRVRVAMHSIYTYRQFVTQLYMEGRQCCIESARRNALNIHIQAVRETQCTFHAQ